MKNQIIPKIIHYCWLSKDPFPELISQCIDSWKKYLPDYKFVLWDTKKINLDEHLWVKQAFESKKYAFAADYIRIYAVYNYGGIYLDTDVEVLKSFDEFLTHKAFTGFESKTDIEAAVIGAQKGNPWLGDILKYYEGRSFIKADGSFDTKILPVIMSVISKEKYGFIPDGNYQILAGNIHVYPENVFSPKDIITHKINLTRKSVSIHHFNAGWIQKGFLYKTKRYIHLFLLMFGESFHHKLVEVARRFSGNSKLD